MSLKFDGILDLKTSLVQKDAIVHNYISWVYIFVMYSYSYLQGQ